MSGPSPRTLSVSGADLINCSLSLTERFGPVTWRALRDAGLNPTDIDELLLVGGASRMHLVHQFIERMFGKAPRINIDPDTVVARGAAVQGGLIAGNTAVDEIVATDVIPHTLGCNVSKELGSEVRSGYFMPIIHRNTTIPTSRVEQLSTTQDGQTSMAIEIYQGEVAPRLRQPTPRETRNRRSAPTVARGRVRNGPLHL